MSIHQHQPSGRPSPVASQLRYAPLSATSTRGTVAFEEAVGVLTGSFHAQPHFIDLFPDVETRTRALPQVFAALLADAAAHGRIDTASYNGKLAGAAVWYPPEAYPLSVGRQLRALPTMLRLASVAPRSLRRAMRFQAASARLHPAQPYWYLAAIGVDPLLQGVGAGTGLLTVGLEQVDAADQAAYLETHTPRNVGWYRTYGFEVQASEIAFTPGGPPNWTMYRPGGQPATPPPRHHPANDVQKGAIRTTPP